MRVEDRTQRVKDLLEVDDLLEVYDLQISDHIENEYRLICPLPNHKDTAPSFSFNVLKKIFHCFGCGNNGDFISFVMKMENTTFMEALEFLEGLITGQYRRDIEITDRRITQDSLLVLIKNGKIRIDKHIAEINSSEERMKLIVYTDLSFSYFLQKARDAEEESAVYIKKEFLNFFKFILNKIS